MSPAATPAVRARDRCRAGRSPPRGRHGFRPAPAPGYWELAGPESVTLAHLREQLATGHSTPCLGVL
ncbi:hypothetical protein ACWD6S_38415, partial [Streptomyces zhihengii]